MSEAEASRATLTRMLRGPEEHLDLGRTALLIAAEDYPGLDVDAYIARLDGLAERALSRLGHESPTARIQALNHCLFYEEGFRGNIANYYDPKNSFLNEVLDRRLGIPITLSLVYMEVAARLELPVQGISFPGHFLVRLPCRGGHLVLDPFCQGASLNARDLVERARRWYRRTVSGEELARLLAPASKRDILVRMLRNLKHIYLRDEQADRALSAIDRILLVSPESIDEHRERAELYYRLECFRAALADYTRYLALAPEAARDEHVRARVTELKGRASRLN